jgi:hypothetical protein
MPRLHDAAMTAIRKSGGVRMQSMLNISTAPFDGEPEGSLDSI